VELQSTETDVFIKQKEGDMTYRKDLYRDEQVLAQQLAIETAFEVSEEIAPPDSRALQDMNQQF
jgi:hypothetical protein